MALNAADLAGMTTDEKLDFLLEIVSELRDEFRRYKPLLARYERAANAGNSMTAFRALRGKE